MQIKFDNEFVEFKWNSKFTVLQTKVIYIQPHLKNYSQHIFEKNTEDVKEKHRINFTTSQTEKSELFEQGLLFRDCYAGIFNVRTFMFEQAFHYFVPIHLSIESQFLPLFMFIDSS